MPFVETTMIAGYGPDVKQRLVTAFTRSVRSVMAAPLDGVIVVLREVDASCWARGGVSRIPGPALPYAIDVATSFVAAIAAGNHAAAARLADPSLTPPVTVGTYTSLDESYTDNGSLVFAEGTLNGASVLDRFHVVAGKVMAHRRWIGDGAAD